MRALLLVDIQNDFVPGGSLPVPDGDQVVPTANRIMGAFDLVVATQDWHPSGHASFASSHPGWQPFEVIQLAGSEQVLWPDHCVQGSRGAEFHPDLNLAGVEAIIRKGTDPGVDSYSGFRDNAGLRATGLAGYLREKGVTEVFVCGLAGDYCVAFTARDALEAGFSVTLVEDAVRSIDGAEYECRKEELVGAGARFVVSAQVLGPCQGGEPSGNCLGGA